VTSQPAARAPRPKRPGRRPGAPDTRGAILAAARTEFAALGFDGASIRGIAARAQVDPSLVHHYYGSKDRLFAAAMELPIDPATLVPEILAGDPDAVGERLIRTLLRIWGNPATRAPFQALLRSALTRDAAAVMFRQFIARALVARAAQRLELPDRELRVTAAASQIVGLVLMRYVIKIEPLASATDDEVVALVAPTIQRYLSPP
jgi:AcrR family transcriptional regulator